MSAPPPGLALARFESMPDPGALVVELDLADGRLSLIVTRRGDRVAAFRNRCAHAGYPLQRADGRIVVQEGRFMLCAAHGASYGLEDGACAGGPCNSQGLQRIAVRVDDGVVVTI